MLLFVKCFLKNISSLKTSRKSSGKMDMINGAEIATKSLRERKALNTFSSIFFKSNCEQL